MHCWWFSLPSGYYYDCFARNSPCSVILIIGIKDSNTGEVVLRNNSFENCGGKKCIAGGSVYLQYTTTALLLLFASLGMRSHNSSMCLFQHL